MTLAATKNIWDVYNSLVLVNEADGTKQKISIETVNGKRVRSLVDTNVSQNVKELFPNGLPSGLNVVFISLSEKI